MFRGDRGGVAVGFPSNILGILGELIPLAAPTNLTLGGLEGRDALISWAPVAPESVRGTFRLGVFHFPGFFNFNPVLFSGVT